MKRIYEVKKINYTINTILILDQMSILVHKYGKSICDYIPVVTQNTLPMFDIERSGTII